MEENWKKYNLNLGAFTLNQEKYICTKLILPLKNLALLKSSLRRASC